MKAKSFFINVIFLLAMQSAFSQDSAKTSVNKLNIDTTVTTSRKKKHKTKAQVDANSGTSIPNTTSGTLNSTVNPSTQVVIPFGKGRKKK
ncbi:MAG: hypothetical protein ABI683_10185 [Ginsengibacter sp.]